MGRDPGSRVGEVIVHHSDKPLDVDTVLDVVPSVSSRQSQALVVLGRGGGGGAVVVLGDSGVDDERAHWSGA